MLYFKLNWFLAIIYFLSLTKEIFSNNPTLKLVHIIFRHGSRTNTDNNVYPKDPYINEMYYPIGHGQLTNPGKRTMWNLGQKLRLRYNKFLEQSYMPNIVEARSSDLDRTKASLLLVLGGLFPPIGEEIWKIGMNWQPIPTVYKVRKDDPIIQGMSCTYVAKLQQEFITSHEYQEELSKYKDLIAYVEEYSGWKVESKIDFLRLYFCLLTEEEYGFKLPKWTRSIYPSPLRELAPGYYEVFSNSTEILKYTGGFMLQKILEDTFDKIESKLPKERKMYLLSGHDVNCAFMLKILGVFVPHVPPYGANLIFELHEINHVFGYKIFYQMEPLVLPYCGEFCPLDIFFDLYEKYLPTADTVC